jgi:hypothetical protein
VFVEWRPIEGQPYLATLLATEFHDLGSLLRCYVVDPRYHEALSLNPRLQFQEFLAKNVGIRRARGRLVLTTNTDIYLSRGLIASLRSQSLPLGVLYRAVRCDLKSDVDVTRLDWDVLEDTRNYDVINLIQPPLFTNAAGDFLLLDRESYHRLGGFNELYRVAKIHIDGNFCVKAHSSKVPLIDIGAPVFHLGRGTFHALRGLYGAQPAHAPWGDSRWESGTRYVNPPNWGLGSAPERRIDERTIYIDFNWSAVGPMVDLRGLG